MTPLDPFIAPSPEEFVTHFQTDIVNFLNKKIIKDFRRVDLNDLCYDFMAHFFSEGMLKKYNSNYNQIRALKLQEALKEKEKEYGILKRRNHKTKKDKKVLDNLSRSLEKKRAKLEKCQEKVGRLVRFKTYLFWCLRSYWWWHEVKTVDIYADPDGVIREHIKTTVQPLVVSQTASEDDYKYSDISSSIYLKKEEAVYAKELRRQAALVYLEGFENFLEKINSNLAFALNLLLGGLDITEVSCQIKLTSDELISNLKKYGTIFSKKIGNFGEYLEYC